MIRGETAGPSAEVVVAKGTRRRGRSREGRRVLSVGRDRRDGRRCRLHGCMRRIVKSRRGVWLV